MDRKTRRENKEQKEAIRKPRGKVPMISVLCPKHK
jgi:hypothetical protein